MDSVRKQTEDFFRNTAKSGLEIRHGQVEMADEVCTAFEKQFPLAVEAEVGIGKSFAYLVPAILKIAQDHKQIVIATSTIALQEQLNRDAHNVLKMLGVNIDIVVAKGDFLRTLWISPICSMTLRTVPSQGMSILIFPAFFLFINAMYIRSLP